MRFVRCTPILASLCLLLASCSDSTAPTDKNDDKNNQPLTASTVTMKVNGTVWTSQIVQIQSNLYTAASGNSSGTSGSSLYMTLDKITAMGDVPFNSKSGSGAHASAYYTTLNTTTGQSTMYLKIVEDGTAKFTVTTLTDSEMRGTFNCTLEASGGEVVTITDGVFAFKLK